jgi:hypothetical protein
MNNNYNGNNEITAHTGSLFNLKTFVGMGLIVYLLLKAIFSPFGLYPKKYYNQTMTINSNSDNNQDQIVNAYVPGIWNNEMTDIITFIVLIIVIFLLKSKNNLVVYSNNVNYYLIISIVIACIYPPLKQNFSDDPSSMNLFEKIFIPLLLAVGFWFNFTTSPNKTYYIIYLGLIIMIFTGLYLSKNNSEVYQDVLYNVSSTDNKSNCTNYDTQEITVKSSGTVFKLTTVFVLFLSIIALPYNNNIITNVVNGVLIGLFTGMMSFYGFQYPFYRTPSDFCKNKTECQTKNIPTDNSSSDDSGVESEMENKVNWNSWTIMSIALIMVLLLFYLSFQRN